MDFKQSYFEALDLMNEAMVQRNALLEELKRLVADIESVKIKTIVMTHPAEVAHIKDLNIESSRVLIQQIEWS